MIDKDLRYKLKPELVPDSCWYSNLRSNLPKEVWQRIRRKAYENSGGYCAVCGAKLGRFEAHEVWSYDIKTKVQKLEKVIAICPDCHSVIHIGRTQLKGDEDRAIAHFCKVNGCRYADYRKVLGEANLRHEKLNKVDGWMIDVRVIADMFRNPQK